MTEDEFDPAGVSDHIQLLAETGRSYKAAFNYATRNFTDEQIQAVVEYEWGTLDRTDPDDLSDDLREYQSMLKRLNAGVAR